MNGATRLQPCVLLTGQAAGALAALSVRNNQNVRDVSIRNVQQTLLDAGAYLMPLVDVNPSDRDFQAIQRVTASGILKVKGESYKWANRTWFYPDTTITVKEFSEGLKSFDNQFPGNEDPSMLTVRNASDLISAFLNKDILADIQKLWDGKLNRKYDSNLLITKRELSVLVDELIHPFITKTIGFDGNYL